MSWPLSQDYNEAVQDPASSFADPELRQGQPALNPLGLPLPRSGNFADVYEFTCAGTKTKWAVKCFTRHVPGQRERYSEVSRHLQQAKLPFTVDFQYLEQGIRVQGRWYPVLKMRWVEGLLLNAFVRDSLNKPVLLHALGQIWLRMAKRLREAQVAHADLQHGNVLLVPGSKTTSLAVKLIDYDGMWVPALAGKPSGEVGHPNFQHPQRLRDGTYSPEVDRFPLLVVATALRALTLGGRELWERYDNGENLLFKEADLRSPADSPLFAELRGMKDPLLKNLVGQLQAAAAGGLEAAPLLGEVLPEEKPPAKGTAAAAEGVDWSFADGEQPLRRRRKRSGVPAWAWVAAAALVVATLGGAYVATRSGTDDKSGQVAQNRPTPHPPTTAKAGTREAVEKQPIGDPAVADPKNPSADLPSSDPSSPKSEKQPGEVQPPQMVGPSGWVLAYTGSPSGEWVAAAPPGTPEWALIDVATSKVVRKFPGHRRAVTSLALSPDGRHALSGSADGTLRWWDVETGQTLHVLEGHQAGFRIVAALSPDGTRALSADLGPRVRLWDLEAGKEINHFDNLAGGVSAVAFSADGKHFATALGQVTVGSRYAVQRWSLESGHVENTWPVHRQPVLSLAISADGNRVASCDRISAQVGEVGRPGRSFSMPQGLPHQVALSPNGNVLVTIGGAQAIFWNLSTGRTINRDQPGAAGTAAFFQADGSVRWVWCTGDRKKFQVSWTAIPDPEKATAVVSKPPPPPRPARPTREPVPDSKALAAARKEVDQFLKTRTDNQPRRFQLFNNVGGLRNPAARYAALQDCRALSIDEGDINLGLQAADQITQGFVVNRRELRAETITLTAKTARQPYQYQGIAENALRLAGEALADDDFTLASRMAEIARLAAPKVRNPGRGPALIAAAERTAEELAAMRPEVTAYKAALDRLAKDPNDAEANLKVGRFRCIHQDAWEEGLPLLAKGTNPDLKALALKDLAEPAETVLRKEVGNGWWDAARRERDKSPAQRAFVLRACHWYELALPALTADKAEVKRRMKVAVNLLPQAADPWRHLDVSEAKAEGNYLRLEKGKCLFTRRFCKGGVDVTVVARMEKNNIRLTAGDGGVVIFNWEVGDGGIRVQRPDNPAADGRGAFAGSLAGASPRNLEPDKWYTLRWRLTPTGQKVWVDDELVFEKEEPYDLSTPRPVGVCAFFQNAIEVKSVVVKSLKGGDVPTP